MRNPCHTVNTLRTPLTTAGSTRITSKGREAAMDQLRLTTMQELRTEADKEVDDEVQARRETNPEVLKKLREDADDVR